MQRWDIGNDSRRKEKKKKERKGKHVIDRDENVDEARELCWDQMVEDLWRPGTELWVW